MKKQRKQYAPEEKVAILRRHLLEKEPIYTGRTHRHDVCAERHERQPALALQRVLQMKADDGLLLPILQPEVAGEPSRCARSPSRSVPASRRPCLW